MSQIVTGALEHTSVEMIRRALGASVTDWPVPTVNRWSRPPEVVIRLWLYAWSVS